MLKENDELHSCFEIEMQDGIPYALLMRRGIGGAWCGYVGVKKGHWAYGLEYTDDELQHIRVHGGLTFSGILKDYREVPGVNEYWYLGFDCAHLDDIMPDLTLAWHKRNATYKDRNYVRKEMLKLMEQLRNKTDEERS